MLRVPTMLDHHLKIHLPTLIIQTLIQIPLLDDLIPRSFAVQMPSHEPTRRRSYYMAQSSCGPQLSFLKRMGLLFLDNLLLPPWIPINYKDQGKEFNWLVHVCR